jgi:hypothetical protein
MADLIKYVRSHNLTILDHTLGSVSATEAVREGDDNRYELNLLSWDGEVMQAWRSSNPETLLETGLGRMIIEDGGVGSIHKMCLFDRFGGHPHGERVVFTTNAPDTGLEEIFMGDESMPDEFEIALFGGDGSPS